MLAESTLQTRPLSAAQLATFACRGVLRIPGLLAPERVAPTRDRLLRQLARRGLWDDSGWHLDAVPFSTAPNAGSTLVKGCKGAAVLNDVIGTEVLAVVSQLVPGHPLSSLQPTPQVLFTLPNASEWSVPHNIWHLDAPRLPGNVLPGAQMFTFVDTVVPGGGGTLVVAGSQRLVSGARRISSRNVKKRMKRAAWFRDLMSVAVRDRRQFVDQAGCVDGVEVQVVELCGQPGDVYFTDLRLLHTLAPNAAAVPRMMLTQRWLRDDLRDAIYAPENSTVAAPADLRDAVE